MLRQGWGVINPGSLVQNNPKYDPNDYLKAEAAAKEEHLGIFSKNTEILGFIYAKNNFVGQVCDIFDGYIY